ncbi:MAG: sigma-70 family RNA polymerase sigma factor [Propionibacteriaceae bacterium]|nr:sigma-70 family RNA polymerase sigma factor [Propionibacteriaceae bacterium]
MKTYVAHAVRWEQGWELHVEGVGVTQVRTLDKAEQQVRDLVETMNDQVDASDAKVVLYPEIDGLEEDIVVARAQMRDAEEALRHAAEKMRHLTIALRDEKHLSVSDTATVLGVSRGRVSQLTKR